MITRCRFIILGWATHKCRSCCISVGKEVNAPIQLLNTRRKNRQRL
jgi:hypothetical protein